MARPTTIATMLVAALAGAAMLVPPSPASAASPFLVVPEPAVAERTPAYRYANMTDAEAFAELDRRRVVYSRLGEVAGVRAPIRLTARLHGVWFHSSLPPEARVTSAFEILDARLALALDDFASILERHDIDEVVHFTMYRPNVSHDGLDEKDERDDPKASRRSIQGRERRRGDKSVVDKVPDTRKKGHKSAPSKQKPRTGPKVREVIPAPPQASSGKAASGPRVAQREAPAATKTVRVARKSRPSPPGTRHPAGLAIDVGGFRKKDGRWLSVGYHFSGKKGDRTCGEGARVPEQPEARELRSIVCEASDLGVFTYVLTPSYDAAHSDHFHMEIKPGVRWFLVH